MLIVFFQGQGVGSKLIKFAIDNKGATNVWVLEKNRKAISFYAKYGFILSGERILEKGTTEYIVKMIC